MKFNEKDWMNSVQSSLKACSSENSEFTKLRKDFSKNYSYYDNWLIRKKSKLKESNEIQSRRAGLKS